MFTSVRYSLPIVCNIKGIREGGSSKFRVLTLNQFFCLSFDKWLNGGVIILNQDMEDMDLGAFEFEGKSLLNEAIRSRCFARTYGKEIWTIKSILHGEDLTIGDPCEMLSTNENGEFSLYNFFTSPTLTITLSKRMFPLFHRPLDLEIDEKGIPRSPSSRCSKGINGLR
ncbi:unnamed protein product [Lactuca saligna]|uniref:Uncharacterized protein n=1 Tax=Lactuca saligna TaxID=75948 RepID=A0AA35VXB3_LACSI|nr:unnamed protein product [Lactuca saligna]